MPAADEEGGLVPQAQGPPQGVLGHTGERGRRQACQVLRGANESEEEGGAADLINGSVGSSCYNGGSVEPLATVGRSSRSLSVSAMMLPSLGERERESGSGLTEDSPVFVSCRRQEQVSDHDVLFAVEGKEEKDFAAVAASNNSSRDSRSNNLGSDESGQSSDLDSGHDNSGSILGHMSSGHLPSHMSSHVSGHMTTGHVSGHVSGHSSGYSSGCSTSDIETSSKPATSANGPPCKTKSFPTPYPFSNREFPRPSPLVRTRSLPPRPHPRMTGHLRDLREARSPSPLVLHQMKSPSLSPLSSPLDGGGVVSRHAKCVRVNSAPVESTPVVSTQLTTNNRSHGQFKRSATEPSSNSSSSVERFEGGGRVEGRGLFWTPRLGTATKG